MTQAVSIFFSFIFEFPFIILFIEMLFCFSFPKRSKFPFRLILILPYLYLFQSAFGKISPWYLWKNFYHFPAFDYGSINISYVVVFAFSILLLFFLFDTSIWKLLFIGSSSYALQNFSHNLCELLRTTLLKGNPNDASGKDQQLVYYIIKLFVLVLVLLFAYFVLVRKFKATEKNYVDNRFLIVFVTITVSIISVFNYWTYAENLRNSAFYILMMIVNVLLLVIQFSFYDNYRIINEKEMTKNILRSQMKQQAISKENMEIINRKCHDLKYQVEALKKMSETDNRDKVISELEDSIRNFDSRVECGNKILDIVLTEKKRLCDNFHIEFTCIVDGKVLSFMDGNDQYILFSNALDNSIEALRKVQNLDDRILTLRIEKKQNIISIAM